MILKLASFLHYLKDLWKGTYVRVVYIYGLNQNTLRTYKINQYTVIKGCEGYDLASNEVLKYKVSKGTINIHVPIYLDDKPFNLEPDGRLSPAFECKGKGKIVDYMFWIPEEYVS